MMLYYVFLLSLYGRDQVTTFVLHRKKEMIISLFFFFSFYNSNRITRDGAKCLSEVLKQNRSLEILDLSFNRIEDDGAVYLSEAIKLPHSKLKALVSSYLYNNAIIYLKSQVYT